jgi:methenyltetrahydromethanopterin cyclohydrolase
MTKSVNTEAARLIKNAIRDPESYGIAVQSDRNGVVVDAGIKAPGGSLAGILITDICLGGLGKSRIDYHNYGGEYLPSVFVETWAPALATLGSQYAGWQIKTDDYFAMGSGPARALALKPKTLYEKINYQDRSEEAVILLESDKPPTQKAVNYMCNECKVSRENLYVVVAPTSCLVGSIQIAGRVVETGIHKLTELGLDPKTITFGCGYAPLPPVHPNSTKAIGRTNDAILYGGVTHYTVICDDDESLQKTVAKAPSSSSRDYGKPFYDILKEAKFDFYKIDPNLFAPAVVTISNVKTGFTYSSGKINEAVLRDALGLRKV